MSIKTTCRGDYPTDGVGVWVAGEAFESFDQTKRSNVNIGTSALGINAAKNGQQGGKDIDAGKHRNNCVI